MSTRKTLLLAVVGVLVWAPACARATSHSIQQNQVLELTLQSSRCYSNPFEEVTVDVQFAARDGRKMLVPAWGVRFSWPHVGELIYVSHCSDASKHGLHDQKGIVTMEPYNGGSRSQMQRVLFRALLVLEVTDIDRGAS